MMGTRHSRLRAPANMIIGGAVITAAVAAGYGWGAAIPCAVIAVVAAIGYYVLGGRDSDIGAMYGARVDERQDLLRMKARSFAAQAVGAVVLVGTVVTVALREPIWPFALFGGVEVLAFFAGLAIFRGRDA